MIDTQENSPSDIDPRERMVAHFQRVKRQGAPGMVETNPALAIEAVDFVRYRGDWLGVLIAPWFIRLFLLPGGGELWGDIPAGQRRYVELPGGTTVFFAENDLVIGAFQYSPVLPSVLAVPDMAMARLVAVDALRTALGLPPPEAVRPRRAATPKLTEEEPAPMGRRGFFKKLIGRH